MVDFDPDFDDKSNKEVSDSASRKFGDFDCPNCNANNPYDDKFGDGDEVRCYYCGCEFGVRVDDTGRLKLREV